MANLMRADDYAAAIVGTGGRYGGTGNVSNPLNGLGIRGLDATASNRMDYVFRNDADLTRIYLGNGLAARIVDMAADDALARGFEIDGDDDDHSILNECNRLGMRAKVADAVRWARLYGGAAIVLVVDDGQMLPMPLNEAGINRVVELKVFDATQITPAPGQYYNDPMQSNFGMPEVYNLVSPIGGVSFFCHESRMLFFSGDPVPAAVARTRSNGLLWRGRSALEGAFDDIIRYGAALGWSERMLERKQQAVYSMEGLASLIMNGQQDLARQRVNAVDIVRNLLNTVVIDGGMGGVGGDKYEVKDLSLLGVTDQLNQFQLAISADTGYPVTVLFGRSPAGQNATGESDMESYYRLVGHIQDSQCAPAMTRMIGLLLLQSEFSAALPERWSLKFNPLWVPSDKDQAQTELFRGQAAAAHATAAQTFMDAGVLTNVEVRDDLIEQGLYGIEGEIDQADLEEMQPDPVAVQAPKAPARAPTA